jgi:zinc protease
VTDSPPAFPFPIETKTLPNGLQVVVVPYDSPGLVAYYSVVRAGSRNEVEPGKSGFAHFFEHMMFRGTARFPTEQYNAVIKRMGADSNAFTSDDLTVYHLLASKAALPTIVDIEADRFQHLDYAESEFQKEAKAVLGEYNKGASDPMQSLVEALYDHAFQVHTYKHTTIGFLRDIQNMPNEFQYSRQFFDRYYRPDNVILLVVGDVVPAEVFALVQRHYGAWKTGPQRPAVPVEPPQTREVRVEVPWRDSGLVTLLSGYHVPAFSVDTVDSASLEILSELLFSERGLLHRKLVLEEQKVESLDGGSERHRDPSLFQVIARIKAAKDLPYVESVVDGEIARIARECADETTLREIRAHLRYAFAANLSTADNVALIGAEFLALTGDLGTIEAYFQRLSQVTSQDLQRVARTYLLPTNRTTAILRPEAP